jgi:hypothetical protein
MAAPTFIRIRVSPAKAAISSDRVIAEELTGAWLPCQERSASHRPARSKFTFFTTEFRLPRSRPSRLAADVRPQPSARNVRFGTKTAWQPFDGHVCSTLDTCRLWCVAQVGRNGPYADIPTSGCRPRCDVSMILPLEISFRRVRRTAPLPVRRHAHKARVALASRAGSRSESCATPATNSPRRRL